MELPVQQHYDVLMIHRETYPRLPLHYMRHYLVTLVFRSFQCGQSETPVTALQYSNELFTVPKLF